jgi:hypothetical protein
MGARIRKRGAPCDICAREVPDVPFIVEVNDSNNSNAWFCPRHFERDMKIWRKADALVKALKGGEK